jgi:hypothetical protein
MKARNNVIGGMVDVVSDGVSLEDWATILSIYARTGFGPKRVLVALLVS